MCGAETRYSRQMRFAPLGEQGQAGILRSTVAIVGCGALGTVQAEILARAGIGTLRLIDRDFVEWSNLQRQFLFDEADAADATPKPSPQPGVLNKSTLRSTWSRSSRIFPPATRRNCWRTST